MAGVRTIDVHQHLWPAPVLTQLEQRPEAPFARWRDGRWDVTLAGEPTFQVDPGQHDPERRCGELAAAGLDGALVALSSPLGVESLPVAEAEPVLDAWADAATALPAPLDWWATLPLDDPDPARVAAQLDRGAAGLVVPAGALGSEAGVHRLGPVLELLERRLAPLFVHPGPATGTAEWWGPSVGYVAELHAAWFAFTAWGRPRHPGLRVLYAALAGLAPVHVERAAGRGAPLPTDPDPLSFYDTSSYGPRAIRAMACAVGPAQLVFGTDHPVLPLPLRGSAEHTAAADALLGRSWVIA